MGSPVRRAMVFLPSCLAKKMVMFFFMFLRSPEGHFGTVSVPVDFLQAKSLGLWGLAALQVSLWHNPRV